MHTYRHVQEEKEVGTGGMSKCQDAAYDPMCPTRRILVTKAWPETLCSSIIKALVTLHRDCWLLSSEHTYTEHCLGEGASAQG